MRRSARCIAWLLIISSVAAWRGYNSPGETILCDVVSGVKQQYSIEAKCSKKWLSIIANRDDASSQAAQVIIAERCIELVPEIIKLSRHDNSHVRKVAVEMLGALRDERGKAILLSLTGDGNGEVAASAIEAYCAVFERGCKELLVRLARESDIWQVRQRIFYIARRYSHDFDASIYLHGIEDPDSSVGEGALDALPCELMDDARILERVMGMADGVVSLELSLTADRRNRGYASIRALARCRTHKACDHLRRIIRDVQQYRLEEERTWSLVRSISLCCGTAGQDDLAHFIELHPSPPEMAAWEASNVGTALEEAFNGLGDEYDVRASIIEIGLTDSYYRVRLAALRSLERMGRVCVFRDRLEQIEATDSSELVRAEATRVLGSIKECLDEESTSSLLGGRRRQQMMHIHR